MSLIINLFGAPSAGKSTTRAGVFHKLKMAGVNCEEVPEFAKDLVWGKRYTELTCQPYVFGKQLRNMERVIDQVDVVITDSPIILSAFYGMKYNNRYDPLFYRFVISQFKNMGGVNYFLRRVKDYNPTGRNQSEQESDQIAVELRRMLSKEYISVWDLDGDENAVSTIVNDILSMLDCHKPCHSILPSS